MSSGRSLPQSNFGVQGGIQGDSHNIKSKKIISSPIRYSGWWKGERGGRPLTTPDVLPQNWGGNESDHTITCMVLKAMANDRRHLVLCHDEFRGPRPGLYRSGGMSNNNNYMSKKSNRPLEATLYLRLKLTVKEPNYNDLSSQHNFMLHINPNKCYL
ncbi:hypothetical protein TNCV_368041 [Trichonephila clavipes]|nr:hypothetical protein TNCV_368041 [Trichonephila clavipes]